MATERTVADWNRDQRVKEIKRTRELLIETLLPSVQGRRDLAEYVVNNLTVHNVRLLVEAADVFGGSLDG